MKVTSKVTDIDRGYNNLKKTLAKINHSENSVDVGVFGDGVVKGGGKEKVTAPQLVIYAAANEFGTDRAGVNRNIKIPERSYLRNTLEEHKEEVTALFSQTIPGMLLRGEDPSTFLKRMGVWFTAIVQKKIKDGPFTENSFFTILKKSRTGYSDRPLNDTGRLRQSISFKLVKR